ncbi:MAG: DUF4097 family beta strand repeat-containing protein [Bacillota bacterium]|nr:DUF4097 family beta strand repeat-containing protein [Bacillota bacterium]
MNKLAKFFIACGAVFVIGLVMFAAGFAKGGVDGLEKVAADHDWVSAGPGALATVELHDQEFESIESTGVMDVVIVGPDSYEKIVSDYHIEMAVEPKPGTVVAVHGSNIQPPNMKVEGKTLKLNGGEENEFEGINLDFSSDSVYPAVIVFCPDQELDQIKISSVFSDVELRDISFKQADIRLNAGDVETANIVSQGLTIEGDSGDAEISGELKGQTEIKLEAGDIEVETKDALKNYTMKIKSSAGDIKIGEKEIAEETAEGYSYTSDGGKYTLLLETEMGDIEVNRIEQ